LILVTDANILITLFDVDGVSEAIKEKMTGIQAAREKLAAVAEEIKGGDRRTSGSG